MVLLIQTHGSGHEFSSREEGRGTRTAKEQARPQAAHPYSHTTRPGTSSVRSAAEWQRGSPQLSCQISFDSLQCGIQYLLADLTTTYVHK